MQSGNETGKEVNGTDAISTIPGTKMDKTFFFFAEKAAPPPRATNNCLTREAPQA